MAPTLAFPEAIDRATTDGFPLITDIMAREPLINTWSASLTTELTRGSLYCRPRMQPGGTSSRRNISRAIVSKFDQQLEKIRTQAGFIAALDQSGGSTPKALKLYGVSEDTYTNDAEMFSMVHDMRTRIMTSPSFTGKRILGAILFENTMDRDVEDKPTADYLWEVKNVIPFLKVDKGLADVNEASFQNDKTQHYRSWKTDGKEV